MYKFYNKKKPVRISAFMLTKALFFLFAVIGTQLEAHAFLQTITYSAKKVPLKQALMEIERQSDYVVLYNSNDINNAKPVDVDVKDVTISQYVHRILSVEPLDFAIEDKTILISSTAKATSKRHASRQVTINGTVTSASGEPLIGVTVAEKGGLNSTATNEQGEYSIAVSPSSVLVFSYLGYQTKEVIASQAQVVSLEEDPSALDEIIVVGFGTQKRKDVTGSIAQVNADQINNRPVANFGQAMQGLLPGLNVGFSNGSPNTNASFNIRGTTSIRTNSNGEYVPANEGPYVLVDGVPGDINQINPEDIENVTVLRDASAAAIYGARAANGVMLVTTKSGKAGRTSATYSGSFQWSTIAAVPDLLNAYDIQEAGIRAKEIIGRDMPTQAEYLRLEKIKEYMDDPTNQLPYYIDPDTDLPVWRANINPFKEALASSAPLQKHNLSMSGGSDKTTYYFGLGYQNQDGIYKINTDNMKRYNLALNISSQINDWFQMDMRTSFNSRTYIEPHSPVGKSGWWAQLGQDPGRNVFAPMKVPDTPPAGAAYAEMGGMYTDNILSFMDYGATDRETINNLNFTLTPKVTILPGWNVQSDLSYKQYNNFAKDIVPLLWRVDNWALTSVHTSPSYVSKENQSSNQYTINVFTDYSTTIAQDHNLSAVLGFNQEWYTYQSLSGERRDINSNLPVISQATGEQFANDDESHWAVRGLFYRLSYNYKNKYYLQSNGRYDGTSRFRTDRRFELFPSFSAGWVVSEENFVSPMLPYVNFLKFSGSYGTLGNQDGYGLYPYIPTYEYTSQLNYIMGGVRPGGVRPAGLVDAALTWESLTTFNLGVDMTLFNNWSVDFDWYKRTTKNILTPADDLPATLGTDVPVTNMGELVNKGFELILKYNNQTAGGLRYDIALNLSDNKAKVTKFNGNKTKNIGLLYEGFQVGEIWGYETYGIFQSKDEIDAAPKQTILGSIWNPGDVRYVDLDGNGEISPGTSTLDNPGDRRIIGNQNPRYQFGLNGNLRYKNFDFNLFLQGVGKRDLWISHNYFWGAGAIGTYETYNNSWTPERTDAYFPLYYSTGQNRQVQTRYLQNGAYLRVKNISLGYSLPTAIVEKIKLRSLRLNASAFNLFEIKSTPKAFDPELATLNYPMMRSYAFGIQASF
jgi:TonB-linked SusC/RagA family outer membrane protein